jgi:hypothetical protein
MGVPTATGDPAWKPLASQGDMLIKKKSGFREFG